jgi:hypothetical protein
MALRKQIARRFRGTSKGIFRVRLLPGLKLRARFLRLQFLEKMKAGVEFRASAEVCPEATSVV